MRVRDREQGVGVVCWGMTGDNQPEKLLKKLVSLFSLGSYFFDFKEFIFLEKIF